MEYSSASAVLSVPAQGGTMLKQRIRILAWVFCAIWTFGAAASHAADSYTLNPGDILDIAVWKEEGMERQVVVLPDGQISFPLAGHIQAAGMTPKQLQAVLHKRLKNYFADPSITVSVVQVSGNKIFVIGQVNSPGEFLANRPVDVMQALSLAGGLTTFAAQDEIRVLRRGADGKQQALRFNYSDVSKGKDLDTNIILKSGDIVVVPTSGIF
ncbi:MAG: polysaccharide biosynthesis/export family protein [Alphaproteobacteria bacterium]|nr:polysaccharide biosynthesis/export family protein [Alphaproteobacteria bacterium]